MRPLRREKGEGKAAIVFWILVFLIAGLLGKEWIPAKIADMQLRDHVDELAKLYPRKTGEFFVDQIMKRAHDLDIELERKEIQVDKTQQRVRVRFQYKKKLDLIFTSFDITFKHDYERDIFLI